MLNLRTMRRRLFPLGFLKMAKCYTPYKKNAMRKTAVGIMTAAISITLVSNSFAATPEEFLNSPSSGPSPVFVLSFVFVSAIIAFRLIMLAIPTLNRLNAPINENEDDIDEESDNRRIDDSGYSNSNSTRFNYACPHCGAPIESGADVSPHGDSRCGFCDSWFNIHAKL